MNPALAEQAERLLSRTPQGLWWVPGRIEVLGKHTDYGGGRVLTCATDRGLVLAAARRADGLVRVVSNGSEVVADRRTPAVGAPWAVYVDTVVRRLDANFPGLLRGADIAVAADLPAAAGLSSSSALLTGLTVALAALSGIDRHPAWPEELASYCACIENGADCGALRGSAGVGTTGGAMDHTAIIGSRAGLLTCWSLAPTTRGPNVPLPAGTTLLIAVSGVVAEKTGAAQQLYNAVATRARRALGQWNAISGRRDPHLAAALRHGGCDTLLAAIADLDLRRRAEQFCVESDILVPAATQALAAGDLSGFATAVAHSQALAETHLLNQVPETSALVALARAHGAHAASAFGAGFGGAVWALVDSDDDAAFSARWLPAYQRQFPTRAAGIHRIQPGPGLHPLTRS